MTKISVVIPTLAENYERLNKCINSLTKNKSKDCELEFCIVPNYWDGFERPVNAGLKIATADYILIANDDIIMMEPNWDVWMTEGFKQNNLLQSEIGMVSGTGYQWKDLPSYFFVMMSRKCYEKVGGLDENFFVFGSDHDHAMRIKQAGFSINHKGKCPGLFHQMCSTTKSEEFKKKIGDEQRLIECNKQLFEKKWGFR